ncbi:MAG: (2Fe-2S)-binding protein [Chitinivibrionales bacterium]|nr:(2Fe-2S)-binding protein [Chitinivibrionales bacterium]
MNAIVRFTIDKKECMASAGSSVLAAACENDLYIPSLCNYPNAKPRGCCRVCTVRINGKLATACTTPIAEGMQIESETAELNDLRSSLIELLFVEGNHLCPSCEKSGTCELQALGYRFRMVVPRFRFQFPVRCIESKNPKLMKDHNRCILCKRCIKVIKDGQGRSLFAFYQRAHRTEISIDTQLARTISDEVAQKAMDVCPVGAIIRKEKGFDIPIGKRQFDREPIGCLIEGGGKQP